MANGVVIIDMEGRITYANPQAEKILGMRRNTIEDAYYFDNKWKQIDEEGRYLLLELMGYLAGDYRHFAYGNTIQGEKQA